MKYRLASAFLLLLCAACERQSATTGTAGQPLAVARQGFTTHLTKRIVAGDPVQVPPPALFTSVKFNSPVGPLAAYLSPDPRDAQRHPAIIWITGGDCNSIGDVWSPSRPSNDQTAAAYRNAGIIMIFPSLRGGNTNPGAQEKFLGEVDDVLAAADFLAAQPYVDPDRLYLGGHSTGGTLVLLVAETSPRFRATFSFGPVTDPTSYGPDFDIPVNRNDAKEIALRSPIHWLASIHSPTFILEGENPSSNVSSLRALAKVSTSPDAHFLPVPGVTHFSILAPVNALLARKILADTGATSNITLTKEELAQLVK